jgi:hypothetical protein
MTGWSTARTQPAGSDQRNHDEGGPDHASHTAHLSTPSIFVETRLGCEENKTRDHDCCNGDADRQAAGHLR